MITHMKKRFLTGMTLVVVLGLALSGCATPTPEVIEKEVTREVEKIVTQVVQETVIVEGTPQVIEREVTKIVEPTPTATPSPQIGGTLVYAYGSEPDTLDAQKTTLRAAWVPLEFIGASLITKDPNGAYVPYLAESWTGSEDGLTWEFKLKQGVTFHDGTPFTAQDYVYTIERAKNPETNSATTGPKLESVETAEAVDDYTLRLNMKEPYFSILETFAAIGPMQPLSQEAVEQWGDEYGRHPVGVGPYRLTEWTVGNKIALERNPDFDWGPAFVHSGPAYIEKIEIRVLPEAATVLAGLEAGEIHYADGYAGVMAKDLPRLRLTGRFQILEDMHQGLRPFVILNLSKPPFNDPLVRQAFNLAVNRDTLVDVIVQGAGLPAYGPESPTVLGYCQEAADMGYRFDLERARSLMEEAGYTLNDDGFFEKDGQVLELTIYGPSLDWYVRTAEVLQQMWTDLGVKMSVGLTDAAMYAEGRYELAIKGSSHTDADYLYLAYHSSNAGAYNQGYVMEPELDRLVESMRRSIRREDWQMYACEAQKYIVEHAIICPLWNNINSYLVDKRVLGTIWSPFEAKVVWLDAYFETE